MPNYRVNINIEGDGLLRLYKKQSSKLVLLDETVIEDLVKCTAIKKFSISWKDGLFIISSAFTQERETIYLETKDASPLPINFAQLQSSKGNRISFYQVQRTSAEVLRFNRDISNSEMDLGTWFTPSIIKTLVFSLKTCDNFSILFAPFIGLIKYNTYELRIAAAENNQYTILMKNDKTPSIIKRQLTPNILSCNEFRNFWLEWRSNGLSLGKGKVIGRQR